MKPAFLTTVVLLLAAVLSSAAEIRVAAAADLAYALEQLVPAYERSSGNKVAVTYGSSGNFFAQLQSGAPFDVFMSADVTYPRKLVEAGKADGKTLYVYALGSLVLWVPGASPLKLANGLAVLTEASIRKIAIANPEHAPYGRAAVAALKKAGVYEQVAAKLVLGENVSQAAQFVSSGNADAGILALSLALSPAMKSTGRYVELPTASYPALEQAGVVISASTQKRAAESFLGFLQSEEAEEILMRSGFQPPGRASGGKKDGKQ